MVNSKCFYVSSSLLARANAVAFRIVLTQDDGFDVHNTRQFDLALDSQRTVGRASKNSSKSHLLPAKHNMYIDSPVISREHAILSANSSTGIPKVFVTDTKSMHGTYVNDAALSPFIPKQLSNGDKLRFGVNVNRNESELDVRPYPIQTANDCIADYYVAYSYTFNAELSDPEPFSRGFTVPEAESEEEELDVIQSGRGSELDPLVLDDSDNGDAGGSELDPLVLGDSDNEDAYGTDIEAQVDVIPFEELEEEEEEEEDDEITTVDAVDLFADESAADSIADDMAESDVESEAGSNGSAPEYSPEPSSVHQSQYVEEDGVDKWTTLQEIQAVPAEQVYTDPATRQAESLYDFNDFSFLQQPLPTPQPLDDYLPLASSGYGCAFPPPLPPRPSQKRQKIEEAQEDKDERIPSFMPTADRMQTPPLTVPAAAISTMSPPTASETSVPVAELTDDQPPTPTSISNLKRSASDAFDDEAEKAAEQNTVQSVTETSAPTSFTSNTMSPEEVAPTVEQVALQSQRPIAQPRGILRRVLHAAKVMVPATALGAVFTVTALTTLPESFFTVA